MPATRHRISAGAIVEHDGRLLLVRHTKPGAYDFWVAPGGGVQGAEPLKDAAIREVMEEAGVVVAPHTLVYIEHLLQPGLRHCKFWFLARFVSGSLSVSAPQARSEHIVEAAWLAREELQDKVVFPPVLTGRYWHDRAPATALPIELPLRQMAFW